MSGSDDGYFGFLSGRGDGSEINALRFTIQSVLSEVATAAVVKVVDVVNNGEVKPPGVISVQMLVHQIDGRGNAHPHGTIFNVPYKRNQCGPHGIIMDPRPGDIGVIVCASRDISSVKVNKGDASPPGSFRRHDLGDALYIGTVIAKNPPTQYIQFTDDGITLLTPNKLTLQCDVLEINASTSITLTSPQVTVKSPNFSSGA